MSGVVVGLFHLKTGNQFPSVVKAGTDKENGDGTRSKLVGQFPSSAAIFFSTSEICGRPRKHIIFAGKPVLKIILYGNGLTQGYSTYGGSK